MTKNTIYPIDNRTLKEIHSWVQLGKEPILEPNLSIVDPHHHVWHDQRGRYLFEELSEDINSGHHILATVFIQSGHNMYRAFGPEELKSIGEVELVNGIAAMSASQQFGKVELCAGIVGYANLCLGSQVEPVLEALIAAGNGRLRGVRHSMIWDSVYEAYQIPQTRHLAQDSSFKKGLSTLSKFELSFDAWLFHPQLPELIELLRSFPSINFVLNHVGGLLGIGDYSNDRSAVFKIWRENIYKLSQFPNLNIKLGGLGMLRCGWNFYQRSHPPSSVELSEAWKPYIEECIQLFGVERCMFESNFPVDKATCGYDVIWNAFKRLTKDYSIDEKNYLYKNTASKVYRLNISN